MILVFGGGGLLGSTFARTYPEQTIALTKQECDVTDHREVKRAIMSHYPSTIINCAGIVKNRISSFSSGKVFGVNALASHTIASICKELGIRYIYISTDCVFNLNGPIRFVTESNVPDSHDLYGLSKSSGEPQYSSVALTVRTSFVGHPDPNGRGLLSWFSKHDNPVPGYSNWMWNGVTAVELSRYLMHLAYTRDTGILHIGSEPISKYDLLQLANYYLRLSKEIEEVVAPDPRGTLLQSNRFILPDSSNGFIKKGHEQMMKEMAEWALQL